MIHDPATNTETPPDTANAPSEVATPTQAPTHQPAPTRQRTPTRPPAPTSPRTPTRQRAPDAPADTDDSADSDLAPTEPAPKRIDAPESADADPGPPDHRTMLSRPAPKPSTEPDGNHRRPTIPPGSAGPAATPATDCGKPRRRSTPSEGLPPPTLPLARIRVRDSTRADSAELGTILITPCLGDCTPRTLPSVTIGVVVPLPSLLGATSTPGQLADRTGVIPAEVIRHLAAHPDTRLHRLLTDPRRHPARRHRTRPLPHPKTRRRRALARRHLHHARLHHPRRRVRPRPHHPAPARTHRRLQPRPRMPTQPSRQDPRRPPGQPRRRRYVHLDNADRPHLPPRNPTTPRRELARRRTGRMSA